MVESAFRRHINRFGGFATETTVDDVSLTQDDVFARGAAFAVE